MPLPRSILWTIRGLTFGFILLASGAIWYLNSIAGPPSLGANSNTILVIAPYRYKGTWVFDDPAVGLQREPFVAGVPEMIDVLVKDVANAKAGFRMLFSANPFPGYQRKLSWVRADGLGNTYRLEDPPMEGWICPALFRYYRTAPREIYVKAEAIEGE